MAETIKGDARSGHNPGSTRRKRSISAWAALPSVLIAFTFVMVSGVSAHAFNTFNSHRLKYGVYNQYYWLDSTAENSHPTAIRAGVGNWNSSNAPVWYINTSNKSQSRLDFYRRSTSSNSYCAITAMYVDTATVDYFSTDWVWAKVTLDPALANSSLCGPDTHRDGIVAHEQGHAMGLAHHPTNSSVLMYTYVSGTSLDTPTGDDINGIDYLY
ncbi:matrixin family metalloprotease [Streptomyces sp. NPDC096068]|uniref:matrixin family metalloprotease n=1 Tax=Streptomyces sp. NPDC096068 TaxID=3155424 RepID=UPI003333D128